MEQLTSRRARGVFAHIAAVVALSLGLAVLVPAAAQAADADDFTPGFLISDADFFNSTAFTAAQADAFIDGMNKGCLPGRVCLENYTESITAKSANTRCTAIAAASNRSAGQIIATVGKACGISPKAILVILQKEQSLVTSQAPGARAFQASMGAGCPDTAPCDGKYAGFYENVYYGAYLLKGYTIPGTTNYTRYQAGKTSSIAYSPRSYGDNPTCGFKSVYVQNQATHALYVYTPYTPNAAALNNLYGTGDACSAYGNRNFWRLWTDWYGPTGSEGVLAINAFYNSLGGTTGPLGASSGTVSTSEANGGGLVQGYAKGAITWSRPTGAHSLMTGDMRTYYGTAGGLSGWLGWPSTERNTTSASGGGAVQGFQNGVVLSSAAGVFSLRAPLRAAYGTFGSYSGALGWPTGEQYTDASGALAQDFQGGTLFVKGSTSRYVATALVQAARDRGIFTGALGAPTGDPVRSKAAPGGWYQAFAGGTLILADGGQAYVVKGQIRAAFDGLGGVSGTLGWPTTEQYKDPSGAVAQDFQGGTLFTLGTTTTFVASPLVAAARANGIFAGALGTPTGFSTRSSAKGGGWVQGFSGGALAGSDSGDAFRVSGTVRAGLAKFGGLSGNLGWPTSKQYKDATGTQAQDFQGGTIFVQGATPSYVVTPLLASARAHGLFTGALGAPTGVPKHSASNGGGWVQGFAGGALTRASDSDDGFVLAGTLRKAYGTLGGLSGNLGWPTSDSYKDSTTKLLAQDFQGGSLYVKGTSYAAIPTALRAYALSHGALTGSLGWPTGTATASRSNGGGIVQGFSAGALTAASGAEPHLLATGPLRTAFARAGGLSGPLGWPTSESYTDTATKLLAQDFQGGTLLVNAKTGAYSIKPLAG